MLPDFSLSLKRLENEIKFKVMQILLHVCVSECVTQSQWKYFVEVDTHAPFYNNEVFKCYNKRVYNLHRAFLYVVAPSIAAK